MGFASSNGKPAPATDMSLQNNPDERDLRYLKLITGRLQGRSDSDLAAEEGLAARALYQHIKNDGHPICPICGTTYVEDGHCEPHDRKRKPGRGTGERVELPPAKEAIPLFKEALHVLREAIEQLESRKEYFQDGRFVVETHVQGQAYDEGELVEFKGAFAGPGEQFPPEPLTGLIAVYVLAGLPLEPLLSALSREPGEVDQDQLDQNIEGKRTRTGHTPGLKSKAKHVARLIRWGDLPRGANTGEFSADQHEATWRFYRLAQQGLTSKEIEQKLRKEGFGYQDVAQLRKLGLPPPTL